MEEKLEKIIATGYPVYPENQSVGNEIKNEYLNVKLPYAFTCFRCGEIVQTEQTYSDGTGNALTRSADWKIEGMKTNFLYRILGNIPVIGSVLYRRAQSAVDQKSGERDEEKLNSIKQKAFKEVKDRFKVCKECGEYACDQCMADGYCFICSQIREAKAQAEEAIRNAQPTQS